jgi:hypothetical protein
MEEGGMGERGRQREGGKRKEKRVIKGKGRGDGWKGETMERREEGKRRGLLRGKKGETVEWGGDSKKEGRGKEKRFIELKGRGDGWKAETVGRREGEKRRGL